MKGHVVRQCASYERVFGLRRSKYFHTALILKSGQHISAMLFYFERENTIGWLSEQSRTFLKKVGPQIMAYRHQTCKMGQADDPVKFFRRLPSMPNFSAVFFFVLATFWALSELLRNLLAGSNRDNEASRLVFKRLFQSFTTIVRLPVKQAKVGNCWFIIFWGLFQPLLFHTTRTKLETLLQR